MTPIEKLEHEKRLLEEQISRLKQHGLGESLIASFESLAQMEPHEVVQIVSAAFDIEHPDSRVRVIRHSSLKAHIDPVALFNERERRCDGR